jgi:2-hydroxy-3-keto-5-methylthiopentenyl-1-phosphate phosphatase
VLPVGSVIVDFDGTACAHDVAVDLLERFGSPNWLEIDEASERGEIPARECLELEGAMLTAPLEEMSAYAVEHCPLDPTFAPFVRWLRDEGVHVALASDGFGFYIAPILDAAGLGDLPVVTNTWIGPGGGRAIAYDHAHGECIGCGTCKINVVFDARARGRVAFVGEGSSDRFAALYADVAFAKDRLVELATADGVPFVPWETFDDVRAHLERTSALPGPVEPARCPGWTLP